MALKDYQALEMAKAKNKNTSSPEDTAKSERDAAWKAKDSKKYNKAVNKIRAIKNI